MAAASNLKVYTEDGATLVTTVTFTGVIPGTTSDPQTFRLVNDDSSGEVEPANDPYLALLQVDPDTLEPVASGLRAVNERWMEVEFTGVSSAGVDQLPTSSTHIGVGRVARCASLPSGAWVKFNLRYSPPMSAPAGAITFALAGDANGPSVSVTAGFTESDRDAITSGIGDGTRNELVVGGVITASGTSDEFTQWPDVAWVHEGVPHVLLAHAEEHDNEDSAAATLGANEGYWVRYSLGASDAVVQTKSTKFPIASMDPDDIPAVPAGNLDAGGWALVTDDLEITTGDITSRLYAGRFALTAANLNLTIGTGHARADNFLIDRRTRFTLALPASQAEVHVWLLPSTGTFTSTTDGSRPESRALLIGHGPTAASSIDLTAWTTYTDTIGPVPVPVTIAFAGTLTDGAKAYGVWPLDRPGYIVVPRGMALRLHDPGTGNTAGETRVNLSVDGEDAFPSAGTEDRRPAIAFDADPALSVDTLPEVLPVGPRAIFEAELDLTTAYDGTPPSGATLTILVAPA